MWKRLSPVVCLLKMLRHPTAKVEDGFELEKSNIRVQKPIATNSNSRLINIVKQREFEAKL
jgi:hypothetical protein